MRLLFLLCGALFPLAVLRLATPIVGRRDGLLAAGLSLVVPAFAYLGVIAIPDVPLLLFAALALHGYERGVATGRWIAWLLAGVAVALGLATHYRAALIPFAFVVHAVVTRDGRAQWRSPKAWIAGAVGLLGLLPVLLHNLRLDFAPLRFQGSGRHGEGFQLDGLLMYLPSQLAAVGPLMFVALMIVLWRAIGRARRGDPPYALLAIFALAHVGLFFVTSPIADSSHATIHWPAAGYMPLIVLLPAALREFVERSTWPRRRLWAALVPGTGALLLLLMLTELAFGLFGVQALRRPFAGFEEVARATNARVAGEDRPDLVIADNYMLGGNLALALDRERGRGAVDVYFLRHEKNVEHGRHPQFQQWNLAEDGLRERAGSDALMVIEKSRMSRRYWRWWEERCLRFLDDASPDGEVVVDIGADEPKEFVLFRGRVSDAGAPTSAPPPSKP